MLFVPAKIANAIVKNWHYVDYFWFFISDGIYLFNKNEEENVGLFMFFILDKDCY